MSVRTQGIMTLSDLEILKSDISGFLAPSEFWQIFQHFLENPIIFHSGSDMFSSYSLPQIILTPYRIVLLQKKKFVDGYTLIGKKGRKEGRLYPIKNNLA